jgi:hypothetical protein
MNFKKYEKELNKAGYFISTDMIANSRGDIVGQMDPYGSFHSSDDTLIKIVCEPFKEEKKPKSKKKKVSNFLKRARTKKGHFKSDDPSTPDIDEAWE